MRKLILLSVFGLLALATDASARGPYIGFVYPAGGQQGTTFSIRLGGQRLVDVRDVVVSGEGVSTKLSHYHRRLTPQDIQLLREQAKILKGPEAEPKKGDKKYKRGKAALDDNIDHLPPEDQEFIRRIKKRIDAWQNQPACAALVELTFVEVTIAPDAKPGPRQIRLVTAQGVTNPMAFHVGQVPEVARRAMKTARMPVLGNEAIAQRKRPPEEEEAKITVPCTMNGQIAAGEVNRYRFQATKGQRLVITVSARELVPYIADAVPGWFQPVLTLHNASGREVAFSDDYRSKPDPTLYYEVAADGEYVLTINDAIYRGREDFVYRITIGELPFVTNIFPLGQRAGKPAKIEMSGWNLDEPAKLIAPPKDAAPGSYQLVAAKDSFVTNAVPFAIDKLPECFDKESNNNASEAQKVSLPIIVNGRIDQKGDWDVFAVEAKAGDTLVAEVQARRLDSPLDSLLRVTDASGTMLAINDDHSDPGTGMNTHHADSYIMLKLPSDGTYYVHLGDTGRNGGQEYAYRLRISPPRPDFALRVVSLGGGIRSKGGIGLTVFAIRKDGFKGNIRLAVKDPPEGFTAWAMPLRDNQDTSKCGIKTTLTETDAPIRFHVVGHAMIGKKEIVREAIPAEDRMQAFLWRHLVPSEDLPLLVFDPKFMREPKRPLPELAKTPETTETPEDEGKPAAKPAGAKANPKQVAQRIKQLKLLYGEWLLTDEFYSRKMREIEKSL